MKGGGKNWGGGRKRDEGSIRDEGRKWNEGRKQKSGKTWSKEGETRRWIGFCAALLACIWIGGGIGPGALGGGFEDADVMWENPGEKWGGTEVVFGGVGHGENIGSASARPISAGLASARPISAGLASARPKSVGLASARPKSAGLASSRLVSVRFASARPEVPRGEVDVYGADLDDYDLSRIQEFIDGRQETHTYQLSFKDLMKDLMAGRFMDVMSKVGNSLKSSLFSQIADSGRLMGQIIILGVIGAVFTNFSSVFTSSQISETGFFVTYLLLFTYLATSFFNSITIAGDLVGQILGFMQALLPSYFLAASFAGGSLSSMASYEFTLLMIGAVEWLLLRVLLPLVRVYILLVLAGHIAKEDVLSKMTELLGQAVRWSLKTLMGVVLGFHLIQGMVLPYVDSVKNGALYKLAGAIPGVGAGVGAITQMVLGSGVVIKNTIGAAGIIVLVVLATFPVLKLVILMVLYQFVSAVMQPVCDKRIVSCISDTAGGHKLLLYIVAAAAALFIITIAVVCASSNIAYYTG